MHGIDPADLGASVQTALERMCFMLVEQVEDRGALEGASHARIVLESEGERTELTLSGESAFLSELAASMLGIDEVDVDVATEGLQALFELANVCGGEVARLLGGEERRIRSGLPEAVGPDTGALGAAAGECVVANFDSMGNHLRIVVQRTEA